jgi:hypothetical protein
MDYSLALRARTGVRGVQKGTLFAPRGCVPCLGYAKLRLMNASDYITMDPLADTSA